MTRKVFLSIVAPIATLIGLVALFAPTVLLESKGVIADPPIRVWMSEVGVLLIATGVIVFLVRKEPASPSLKAIFIGNILIQIGLLVIEVWAYQRGVITEITGILPNGILHIVLTIAFAYFLVKMMRSSE